jgi:hypothetical protein
MPAARKGASSPGAGCIVRLDGLLMPLFTGGAPKVTALPAIPYDPLPLKMHDAQTVLRFGMALFRSLTVPFSGFNIAFRHSSASTIHIAQIVLRCGKTLFRSLA